LLPILAVGVAGVNANELESFAVNPIFWEDWSNTGLYSWNERNSTIYVLSNSSGSFNSSTISKQFTSLAGEETVDINYFYRNTYSIGTERSSWVDVDFSYRKNHTVTGSVDGVQTDYPIHLDLFYGSGSDSGNDIYLNSHTQTDFDDVRFYNGVTELDYWIQSYVASTSAQFWVELDSIPASPNTVDIVLYYGNVTCNDAANGFETFQFFDNFNDNSFNTTKWQVQAGIAYAESGGTLNYWNDGTRTLIDAKIGSVLENIQYHTSAKHVDQTAGSPNHLKLHQVGAVTNFETAKMWFGGANNYYARTANEGATTTSGALSGTAIDAYGHYYLTWDSTNIKFYADDVLEYTSATNLPDEALVAAFWAGSTVEKTYNDWVFIGKWTTNEPTSTLTSSEESETVSTYIQYSTNVYYNVSSTVQQSFGTYSNASCLSVYYYNWSSTYSFKTYNYSDLGISFNDYLKVEIDLSALSRTINVNAETLNGTEVLDITVYSDVVPERLLKMDFNVSSVNGIYSYLNGTKEVVWVDAPFPILDGLKSWIGTNTGDETFENPYWIYSTVDADEEFKVKCIPFQGFKTLWNWSLSNDNGEHAKIGFRWYQRDGTTFATEVIFEVYKDAALGWMFVLFVDGANQIEIPTTATDSMAIAVWTESTGRSYAYIQTDPESHTFNDFWVYDITDKVDSDSWGCVISHKVFGVGAVSFDNSYMKETEIFYGVREGISQPRFGGMWWLYNPIVMFGLWLLAGIQTLGFIVFSGLNNILAPLIQATTNAVSGLVSYLTSIISTLVNVWNVVATIVLDMVTDISTLITGTIIPFLFANFWTQVNVILATLHTFIVTVLTAFSFAIYGDATIIPTAYTALINGLSGIFVSIGLFFADMITFIVMLFNLVSGQPVIGFSFSSTGFNFIFTIFYYVATYLPIGIFVHLLITLLQAVNSQSIEPLINLMLLYLSLIKIVYDVILSIITTIIGIISAIGGYIPFT